MSALIELMKTAKADVRAAAGQPCGWSTSVEWAVDTANDAGVSPQLIRRVLLVAHYGSVRAAGSAL